MQPKTQLHSTVNKLANKLHKLTRKEINWAYDKAFDHYAYVTKNRIVSLDTGKEIKELGKLKPVEGKKRTHKDSAYFTKWEVFEGFQVLRYFYVKRYLKAGLPARLYMGEVIQHWISPNGKETIRAIKVNGFSYGYFDGWSFGTVMEIRNPHDRYYIHGVPIIPGRKILKEIRRNGFKGNYHKWHPAVIFGILLRNPIAETFIKAKNYEMLNFVIRHEKLFTRFWASYKICMRHKFKMPDLSTWLDHMELLRYFKYDLHNPKFICSPTFIKDHHKLYFKKRKIDDVIAEEKRKRDKIKYEKEEAERKIREERELEESLKIKRKFIDIKFSKGIIDIVVLTNLEDFEKEGEELKHCVYRNRYFAKKDSLILSARTGETRLETIEFDLVDMKIIQSRGLMNQDSEYHKEILSLMNRSIKRIKQIA